jgi:hypothetical protein
MQEQDSHPSHPLDVGTAFTPSFDGVDRVVIVDRSECRTSTPDLTRYDYDVNFRYSDGNVSEDYLCQDDIDLADVEASE